MIVKTFGVFLILFSNFINAQTYKVIGIIDGDTYDILKDNRPERIRMDGIDAPERGMPFNKKAKSYLSDMIFDKYVTVVTSKLDRNGRAVSKTILIDGTDVSFEMIKAGFAWHFKKYSSDPKYARVEIEARNNKLGLWAEPNLLPPWEVRELHRKGVSTKELFENSPK